MWVEDLKSSGERFHCALIMPPLLFSHVQVHAVCTCLRDLKVGGVLMSRKPTIGRLCCSSVESPGPPRLLHMQEVCVRETEVAVTEGPGVGRGGAGLQSSGADVRQLTPPSGPGTS